MNANDRAEQLGRALAEMRNPQRFVAISTELIARKNKRIFTDGMGADGNPLPPYSKNEIRIGKKNTPRKSAAGKYEGGYGEFKAAIGRGGQTNLFLFGLLNSAYSTGIVPAVNGSLLSFGTEIKASTSNPEGKLEGLLKKYPTAFDTSEDEKKLVMDRLRSEIRRIFA